MREPTVSGMRGNISERIVDGRTGLPRRKGLYVRVGREAARVIREKRGRKAWGWFTSISFEGKDKALGFFNGAWRRIRSALLADFE